MNEAMRAELVRFARKHKYDRDQGFAVELMSVELSKKRCEVADIVIAEIGASMTGVAEVP